MAPLVQREGESDYKVNPGLVVLVILLVAFPAVIFLIYRRRIWLSPLWKSFAYKRGKRRYEADKREITQNWVDLKRDINGSRPQIRSQSQPRDQDVFPIVAVPKLGYHNPGNMANYAAQPLQRESRPSGIAASSIPEIPPPAYGAPYISPPPPAATTHRSYHHGTLAPSKKAPQSRVPRNDAIGNPFYPACVNEQIESGSQFIHSSNRHGRGRRLV